MERIKLMLTKKDKARLYKTRTLVQQKPKAISMKKIYKRKKFNKEYEDA